MIKWKKKGLIVSPKNFKLKWWKSFAMDPCSFHLKGNIFRIFFCGRDKKNVSNIGYVDYDFSKFKVVKISKQPVLRPGSLGSFDDNGVTASSALKIKSKIYLYYIGWKPKSTTRYSLMTGLAISKDSGKSFKRFSKAPILKLTDKEPYSILTAPYVLKKGNRWLMWYVSCNEWKNENFPLYDIKFASSKDGLNWSQDGKVSIKLKKGERAVAIPFVFIQNKKFYMYYCYETKVGDYKIGYATSKNGIKWTRQDHLSGIKKSSKKGDWDYEMIAYPHIINHKNKKYMLYNGNSYGKEGFGLAVGYEKKN